MYAQIVFAVAIICLVVLAFQGLFHRMKKRAIASPKQSSESSEHENENSRAIFNLAKHSKQSDHSSHESGNEGNREGSDDF